MGLIFHFGSAEAVAGAHGSGSGSGDGSGYGYGYGSVSGDGPYGYGSGYGDGSGYGSGYGDGSGYGSGYGDGDKTYLNAILDGAVGTDRAAQLRAGGAVLAFWRSGKDGRPSNGGTGEPRKVGTVEEESGTSPCKPGMLHATMRPGKWKGERLWAVALWDVIEVDEGKLAARKREILAEIPNFFGETRET